MQEETFDQLKEEVIDTQLCIYCGQCCAVCSVGCISFKDNGPELDGECVACGQCIEACPGRGAPLKALDRQMFGREQTAEEAEKGLGIYISDRNLVSTGSDIREKGYTGGKLTALLAYLLADPELSLQSILITSSVIGKKKTFVYVLLVTIFTTLAGLIFGYAFAMDRRVRPSTQSPT